jgi:hypothetical protein
MSNLVGMTWNFHGQQSKHHPSHGAGNAAPQDRASAASLPLTAYPTKRPPSHALPILIPSKPALF